MLAHCQKHCSYLPIQAAACLEQVLLLVGGDGHIAGGVGHAGQHKALADLVVIQEALVALVDGTGLNDTGAAGAGTCTAAVWQVNASSSRSKQGGEVQHLQPKQGPLAITAEWVVQGANTQQEQQQVVAQGQRQQQQQQARRHQQQEQKQRQQQ